MKHNTARQTTSTRRKRPARYPAEILYIFKDRHGDEWVEVRWLYTKDEIEDTVPKSRWGWGGGVDGCSIASMVGLANTLMVDLHEVDDGYDST